MHSRGDGQDDVTGGAIPGGDVSGAVRARLAVIAFSLGASTVVTVALSSVLFR